MPKPCITATVHDQAVGPVPDAPVSAAPAPAPDPAAPADPPPDTPVSRPARTRPPVEEQAP